MVQRSMMVKGEHHPCQLKVEKYIPFNYIALTICDAIETNSLGEFLGECVSKYDRAFEVSH